MTLKADFMTLSERLFKELNWLPFPKRVQYHTCLIVYKKYYRKSSRIYLSLQCSRISRNTMRGKPGQQLSIYCTFPDHIQPSLTGHFQFKVQNYGIAYQRTLRCCIHNSSCCTHNSSSATVGCGGRGCVWTKARSTLALPVWHCRGTL